MPGKSRKCSIKEHFHSRGLLLESSPPSCLRREVHRQTSIAAFSFHHQVHCPLLGLIRGGHAPWVCIPWRKLGGILQLLSEADAWREIEVRLLSPGPVLVTWDSANRMSSHSIVLWCPSPEIQGIGVPWMIKGTDGNVKMLISTAWKRPGAPDCLVPWTSWEMSSSVWDSCTPTVSETSYD